MGVGGGIQQTPWEYTWEDIDGRKLTCTVNFTQATGVLLDAVVFRDGGCRYATVYFGVGANGRPESSTKKLTVNAGTTNITKAMLNSGNLVNISDILAGQVTAGP